MNFVRCCGVPMMRYSVLDGLTDSRFNVSQFHVRKCHICNFVKIFHPRSFFSKYFDEICSIVTGHPPLRPSMSMVCDTNGGVHNLKRTLS